MMNEQDRIVRMGSIGLAILLGVYFFLASDFVRADAVSDISDTARLCLANSYAWRSVTDEADNKDLYDELSKEVNWWARFLAAYEAVSSDDAYLLATTAFRDIRDRYNDRWIGKQELKNTALECMQTHFDWVNTSTKTKKPDTRS